MPSKERVYRILSVAVAEIALCPCHGYEIVKVRETCAKLAMQRPAQVRALAQLQTILVVGTQYLSVLRSTVQGFPVV
jgi:hypothetical protein